MSKIINKIQLTEEETAYLESILRQAASEARYMSEPKFFCLSIKDIPTKGLLIN